jgi:hypothetical protein
VVLNRKRRATEDEARVWWSRGQHGIAILCGAISGNAECIDFDDGTLAADWIDLIAPDVPRAKDRLCVVQTPSHGWHIWYRCPSATIPGNKKLACNGKDVLIETRGEGGYALIPGGPIDCHPAKLAYILAEGPPLHGIQEITPTERATMIAAARSFNRAAQPMNSAEETNNRPGDDYNVRGPDWSDILTPKGWKCLRTTGQVRYWQRPGKEGNGISATTGACKGHDGAELFYVFSSNAQPFEDGKAYSKFRTFALLYREGDLSAAAGELRRQGFGAKEMKPQSTNALAPTGTPAPAAKRKPITPGPEEAFTASQLLSVTLPPVRWAVPDLIAEGMSILAGRPKIGKSWLLMHIAIAIATGGRVLQTTPVEQGPVLYLALEDTPRRLQKRIRLLQPQDADLSRLHLRTRWPRLLDGGLELLEQEIRRIRPRLVVVDTLAKIRTHKIREDNAYAADYGFVAELKRLADDHSTSLLGNHHTSKSPRSDPVDEVSGTLGLTGAADSVLVLKRERQQSEATLFLTGRDVEEQEIAITADVANQVWQSHGSAAQHRMSQQRKDVLELLGKHPGGLRPRDIADLLAKNQGAVRGLLWKMLDDGQVYTREGRYVLQTVNGVNGVNDSSLFDTTDRNVPPSAA